MHAHTQNKKPETAINQKLLTGLDNKISESRLHAKISNSYYWSVRGIKCKIRNVTLPLMVVQDMKYLENL